MRWGVIPLTILTLAVVLTRELKGRQQQMLLLATPCSARCA